MDICPEADSLPQATRGARALMERRWGHTGSSQSAPSVLFTVASGGLASIILAVSGTVSLQFQSPLVSISLRPILRTVAADVRSTVWSSCSQLLYPDLK